MIIILGEARERRREEYLEMNSYLLMGIIVLGIFE